MKAIGVILFSLVLLIGTAPGLWAQTPTAPPAGDQAPATAPDAKLDVEVKSKSEPASPPSIPDMKVEGKVESRSDSKDDGSALPRSTTVERTTIFGLSPTAAIVIGAALLLIVILALVAMARSNDMYIDTNRRL